MLEFNKVYHEDCLTFMKRLPDNYFDLIITDPPYGINADENQNKAGLQNKNSGLDSKAGRGWKIYRQTEWDKERPTKEVFKEMLRVSKNQIIWGGNYFIDYLHPSMCWLIWNKGQRGFSLADGEMAWTSFDKAMRIFDYSRAKFLNSEKRKHPTQKPVELGRWILNKFAKEGDLIFDPFTGSGSFLLACKQLGFRYIGCEIDKEYVEITQKRLSQKVLFPLAEQQEGGAIPPKDKSLGILANFL